MNNFMISLQKFFKNKNTVTIIGVVAIILILFFGYRYQIKKQVKDLRKQVTDLREQAKKNFEGSIFE